MKRLVFLLILVIYPLSNLLRAQASFPNREQRVYSLSLIWKELGSNFAFPENLKKANLDSLYMAYLPKIDSVSNHYEYYRTLCAFMANFNEAHTRVLALNRPDDIPPLVTSTIGEKMIVSNISRDMVGEIPVGSEIIKVNHIPAIEYVRDSVYQYVSAATPHWKFDKAVTEMLYGKPQSTVHITIKTPKGKERGVDLIRNYHSNGGKEIMADTTSLPPISIKMMSGKIGYIQLNTFSGSSVKTINSVFNSYLPQLRSCRGLIIDIRGNRGGTDEAWENIAYHLLAESQFALPMKFYSRKNIAAFENWGKYNSQFRDYYLGTSMEEIRHAPYVNTLNDSLKLHQPVVILSGQYVGSAAEDFLLLMKGSGRVTVVGTPSVGCVGEPMFISLPGGYDLLFCAKKYVHLDGSQPNDTGILPDIEVERNYNAYLKGKDSQLESAINELLVP